MTKELNETLSGILSNLGKKDRAIGNMPVMKGQVLTFIDGKEGVEEISTTINGTATKYAVFKTAEGYNVPFSQIARNNNGLGLTAKTYDEAITEFADRIDGTYSVRVKDVKKVESSFNDGKMTYWFFE